MTYAHWTNHEIQKLVAVHATGKPSIAELTAMFPRHPVRSIQTVAFNQGLKRGDFKDWLRFSHEYFARREAGMSQ